MSKNILRKVCAIFIMIIVSIVCISSTFAANTKDLEDQSDNLDSKIDEAKDKQDEIHDQMTQTEKDINKLNTQIGDYEYEITDLENQLGDLATSISESEVKLEEAQKEYDKKQGLLQEYMVDTYEAGEITFLDMLLSAQSLSDFISTYYLVSEVASYENDLLEQIDAQKKEIEATKIKLEKDKEKVETIKENKEKTASALRQAKSVKAEYVNKLSEDDKKLAAQIEQFEKDKRDVQAQIDKILEEEKNQGNTGDYIDNPSQSGYIMPIAGTSKGNITCGYGAYSGHTGVDFSGGFSGRQVRAVKSGTVVISQSTWGDIPNYGTDGNYVGSYRSYGEYVLINHHDGTMTLYAHGMAGSRKVQAGQQVSQGQVLMNVGNTGNVSPRPSPSDPIMGTHLHFEVRVNGRSVNPTPYLP